MNRYPTKRFAAVILSLIFPVAFCTAQNISGQVNAYYSVTAINTAPARVTLTSTAGLTPGTRVIIMQMKGATIDVTNTANFGNINAINNAGNYEINTVCSISGNDVLLQYAFLRSYTVSGLVQLITLPVYVDAVVTDKIIPAPWNPVTGTGGVVAFQSSTLTLLDSIDASGAGFNGATYMDFPIPPYDCNFATNISDYAISNPTPNALTHGARKGEGVAIGNASYELGRGKLANGGGGGNNHNIGGGGGGNWGAGGVGGQRSNEGAFNCHGQFPGIGGLSLQTQGYSIGTNKIFMGGGGGAGEGNNNVGMHGANGGGIVIIITGTLTGNNNVIAANGARPYRAGLADPYSAGGDGGGGGGAGGTVIMEVSNYTGNVQVQAMGGRGSDASYTPSPGCFGPGGGGGGGVIWVKGASVNPLITSSVTGGANGLISVTTSVAACRGLANGASPGVNGTVQANYPLPVANSLLCIPLPIDELLSFKYKEKPSSIELNWKLSDVNRIKAFELERSFDRNNFITLTRINKQGFNYSFIDEDPTSRLVYYRLKTFYLDGDVAYSEMLTILRNYGQNFQLISVSPNPTNENSYLLIESDKQVHLTIELYNSIGKRIFSERRMVNKGLSKLPINLSNLHAGAYYLKLTQSGKSIVKPIIKDN